MSSTSEKSQRWWAMNLFQLRDELKFKGLETHGSKPVLVRRLEVYEERMSALKTRCSPVVNKMQESPAVKPLLGGSQSSPIKPTTPQSTAKPTTQPTTKPGTPQASPVAATTQGKSPVPAQAKSQPQTPVTGTKEEVKPTEAKKEESKTEPEKPKDWWTLSMQELKNECSKRSLSFMGNKYTLVNRLKTYEEQQEKPKTPASKPTPAKQEQDKPEIKSTPSTPMATKTTPVAAKTTPTSSTVAAKVTAVSNGTPSPAAKPVATGTSSPTNAKNSLAAQRYEKMTFATLKIECVNKKLNIAGTKQDLVDRLVQYESNKDSQNTVSKPGDTKPSTPTISKTPTTSTVAASSGGGFKSFAVSSSTQGRNTSTVTTTVSNAGQKNTTTPSRAGAPTVATGAPTKSGWSPVSQQAAKTTPAQPPVKKVITVHKILQAAPVMRTTFMQTMAEEDKFNDRPQPVKSFYHDEHVEIAKKFSSKLPLWEGNDLPNLLVEYIPRRKAAKESGLVIVAYPFSFKDLQDPVFNKIRQRAKDYIVRFFEPTVLNRTLKGSVEMHFFTKKSAEDSVKELKAWRKDFKVETLSNKLSIDAALKKVSTQPEKLEPLANRIVFLNKLPMKLKEGAIAEKFSDAASFTIARDAMNVSKGYGFVEYKSRNDAQVAVNRMKNVYLEGNRIELKLYPKVPSDITDEKANLVMPDHERIQLAEKLHNATLDFNRVKSGPYKQGNDQSQSILKEMSVLEEKLSTDAAIRKKLGYSSLPEPAAYMSAEMKRAWQTGNFENYKVDLGGLHKDFGEPKFKPTEVKKEEKPSTGPTPAKQGRMDLVEKHKTESKNQAKATSLAATLSQLKDFDPEEERKRKEPQGMQQSSWNQRNQQNQQRGSWNNQQNQQKPGAWNQGNKDQAPQRPGSWNQQRDQQNRPGAQQNKPMDQDQQKPGGWNPRTNQPQQNTWNQQRNARNQDSQQGTGGWNQQKNESSMSKFGSSGMDSQKMGAGRGEVKSLLNSNVSFGLTESIDRGRMDKQSSFPTSFGRGGGSFRDSSPFGDDSKKPGFMGQQERMGFGRGDNERMGFGRSDNEKMGFGGRGGDMSRDKGQMGARGNQGQFGQQQQGKVPSLFSSTVQPTKMGGKPSKEQYDKFYEGEDMSAEISRDDFPMSFGSTKLSFNEEEEEGGFGGGGRGGRGGFNQRGRGRGGFNQPRQSFGSKGGNDMDVEDDGDSVAQAFGNKKSLPPGGFGRGGLQQSQRGFGRGKFGEDADDDGFGGFGGQKSFGRGGMRDDFGNQKGNQGGFGRGNQGGFGQGNQNKFGQKGFGQDDQEMLDDDEEDMGFGGQRGFGRQGQQGAFGRQGQQGGFGQQNKPGPMGQQSQQSRFDQTGGNQGRFGQSDNQSGFGRGKDGFGLGDNQSRFGQQGANRGGFGQDEEEEFNQDGNQASFGGKNMQSRFNQPGNRASFGGGGGGSDQQEFGGQGGKIGGSNQDRFGHTGSQSSFRGGDAQSKFGAAGNRSSFSGRSDNQDDFNQGGSVGGLRPGSAGRGGLNQGRNRDSFGQGRNQGQFGQGQRGGGSQFESEDIDTCEMEDDFGGQNRGGAGRDSFNKGRMSQIGADESFYDDNNADGFRRTPGARDSFGGQGRGRGFEDTPKSQFGQGGGVGNTRQEMGRGRGMRNQQDNQNTSNRSGMGGYGNQSGYGGQNTQGGAKNTTGSQGLLGQKGNTGGPPSLMSEGTAAKAADNVAKQPPPTSQSGYQGSQQSQQSEQPPLPSSQQQQPAQPPLPSDPSTQMMQQQADAYAAQQQQYDKAYEEYYRQCQEYYSQYPGYDYSQAAQADWSQGHWGYGYGQMSVPPPTGADPSQTGQPPLPPAGDGQQAAWGTATTQQQGTAATGGEGGDTINTELIKKLGPAVTTLRQQLQYESSEKKQDTSSSTPAFVSNMASYQRQYGGQYQQY